MRFGTHDCVNDNAARLANAPFPTTGSIVPFGDHRIYIAVVTDEYPREVLDFVDPLPAPGCGDSPGNISDLCTRVEVMMAGDSTDSRRSKLLAATDAATASAFQTPIQAVVQRIRAPIAFGDHSETATAVAELEKARTRLLDGARELEQQQRQLDTIQR